MKGSPLSASRSAYFWATAWGIVAFVGTLGGPAIVLYQIFHWLKYGVWLAVPNLLIWSDIGLNFPVAHWAGIQKIIIWIMDCPASLTGIIVGSIAIQLSGHYSENGKALANLERKEARAIGSASERS